MNKNLVIVEMMATIGIFMCLAFVLISSTPNISLANSTEYTEVKKGVYLKSNYLVATDNELNIIPVFENKDNDLDVTIADINGQEMKTLTKYYDNEGNEVPESIAIENGSLKAGYTYKEYFDDIGLYTLTVKNLEEDKEYVSNIIISDKTNPELELQEISVNKEEDISVNDFIKNITDNSGENCFLTFVDDNGEPIYEIDKSIGNHTVKIKATDKAGNVTVKEANYTIKDLNESNSNNNNNNNNNNNETPKPANNGNSRPINNKHYYGPIYDTTPYRNIDNPIVQKALTYVGRSGIWCTEVVNYAKSAFPGPYKMVNISLSELQPGDILYYAEGGRGSSHVAIYIGNGEAIHGGWGSSISVAIYSMYVEGASIPTAKRLVAA